MSQLAQTRPRSISEIVDASFRFYRARFGDLLVVSALLLVPPALLAAVAPDWLALTIKFVSNWMYLIVEGAVAILVAASLERSERSPRATSSGHSVAGQARVIAVSIMSGLMVMIGTILLVIPGIIAAAWTHGGAPGRGDRGTVERGGDHSLARARPRTAGPRARHDAARLAHRHGSRAGPGVRARNRDGDTSSAPTRLTDMITQLVMVPLFPLIGVAVTLLYYDLRVRSEGADVSAMIDALPGAQPEAS